MQRFVRSGAAFIVVAFLCIAAGLLSKHGTTWTIIGFVWLIIAIGTRRKYSGATGPGQSERTTSDVALAA